MVYVHSYACGCPVCSLFGCLSQWTTSYGKSGFVSMAAFETLPSFALITTSHWLLYLPSDSVFFCEVGLFGNVILNLRTEPERSCSFLFLSKGKLRPRGMMSWAFAQAQDTWQLSWGPSGPFPNCVASPQSFCLLGSWCPGL